MNNTFLSEYALKVLFNFTVDLTWSWPLLKLCIAICGYDTLHIFNRKSMLHVWKTLFQVYQILSALISNWQ